jgi:hypothetical protein
MTRARDVADTQDNLGGAVAPVVAGKNCIINGGMDFFQRGSFTGNPGYALDRWYFTSGANTTVTQSTAKTTPNSQFMMLMTATGTQQIFCYQYIETKNAISYAGKTATLSAYAAGLSTTTNWIMILEYSTAVDSGVGGTWTTITATGGNPNLTLSSTVTRWSAMYAIPSDAKSLRVLFVNNAAFITVGQAIYMGDVQLELGAVATPFARAGGSIGGELALCQRYYQRLNANSSFAYFGFPGWAFNANQTRLTGYLPVPMRVYPTSLDVGGNPGINDGVTSYTGGSFSLTGDGTVSTPTLQYQHTGSGLSTLRLYVIQAISNANTYFGFGAEL